MKKTFWGGRRYCSLDYMLKERYGEKLYKLSLNGGMTCPNRDGKISEGGCIFAVLEVREISPQILILILLSRLSKQKRLSVKISGR